MIEDSDLNGIGESPYEETLTVEEPEPRKRPARARRLIGLASLALLLIVAVIALTPSLRNDFLPKLAVKAGLMRPAPVSEPEPLPAVPVLWERLSIGSMPSDIAENLRSGKYYYEKRLPGNFGLAIDYWKKAATGLDGANRDAVLRLVESAETELARQFSADSADAFVLLKQGKQNQAVALLLKMRADYLDINAPQYVWASRMLQHRVR